MSFQKLRDFLALAIFTTAAITAQLGEADAMTHYFWSRTSLDKAISLQRQALFQVLEIRFFGSDVSVCISVTAM